MRLLLDTCTFLWAALDDPRLSAKARGLILDPASKRMLSSASSWEIALKASLKRLPLPGAPKIWVPTARERLGVDSLPVDEEAALQVAQLPHHHADPFDRLLVAQALVHDCVILTPDPEIHAYAVRVTW